MVLEKNKKILFVSEYLNPPYDEGIKKATYNLFKDLENKYDLHVICRAGYNKNNISIVKTNALFLAKSVSTIIKRFNPDVIIYFPFASGTFASYLRLKIFQIFRPNTKLIFINLQNKPISKWQKLIVRHIKPDVALTPSQSLISFWDSINIKCVLFPLMTDIVKFKPIENKNLKYELRRKYDLPKDVYIISHMGHLNETRNLRSLIPLQKAGFQIVVVGSSSTPLDSVGPTSLKQDLETAGIIILDGYIKHIEEVYQLSDIYIFPVVAINGSISFPLSVLEARACHVPVISSDYGSLKHFLGDDIGGIYYCKEKDFLSTALSIKKADSQVYNQTKVQEMNTLFFNAIYNEIDSH